MKYARYINLHVSPRYIFHKYIVLGRRPWYRFKRIFFSLISEQIANLCIQYNLIFFSPDYHYSTCLWSCSWRWRNWTRSTAHGCDEFRPRPLDLYSFPKRNSHITASCCGDGNKTEAKHIAKTFPKSQCLRSADYI